MYKKAWACCCFATAKPIAFLPFSLTSPSSLLKLPNEERKWRQTLDWTIYNMCFKGNSGVMSQETVGSWLPIGGRGGGDWRRRKDSYLKVTGNLSSRLGVENLTLSVQDGAGWLLYPISKKRFPFAHLPLNSPWLPYRGLGIVFDLGEDNAYANFWG